MPEEYKPYTVMLDLVQGCNRSCSFCGTNGFERKIYYATEETVRRECDLIRRAGYNPRIFIAGNGEPTLHPDLIHLLKIIREMLPKSWIQLATNGYFIKKHGYSYINKMLPYINDLSMDDYEGDFNKEAIKVEIEIYNAMHTKDSCEFAVLKDGVPFYAEKNFKKKRVLLIPNISKQDIASRKFSNHCGAGMPPTNTHRDKKCTIIFRSILLRYNGDVAICCQDFRGEYFVCNCHDENIKTFKDVWLHPRLESARRVIHHLRRKAIYPCVKCNAPAMRVGFLPKDLPQPTSEDIAITQKKYKPITNIRRREWETA